jgi:diphthine-ammonia ligase
VSYLEHAGASAAVICGRGYSNSCWGEVSSRLKTAAHFKVRLSHALSVRMFYKHTATGGDLALYSGLVRSSHDLKADLPPVQSLFGSHSPAITPVPCRYIHTRDENDWDYALCILAT